MKVKGLALLVALVIGAGALAQQARDSSSFDALDKDKDGVITASEARADPAVASRFAAADKNQDGYLSRAEFNELRK
jgi:Ca2+-binding EF-hand superfamily protein